MTNELESEIKIGDNVFYAQLHFIMSVRWYRSISKLRNL